MHDYRESALRFARFIRDTWQYSDPEEGVICTGCGGHSRNTYADGLITDHRKGCEVPGILEFLSKHEDHGPRTGI